MLITQVHIKKFRGFHDQTFEVGSMLTAIAGQNGTQKSTLLGMITQTFTLGSDNPMSNEHPLCGGSYRSAFSEKFRLSPDFDKPGDHEWTLYFDDGSDYTIESIKRSDSKNVRFWQKGQRGKGDGYIQYPTIFLSLKRVLPIAESGSISKSDLLTPNEVSEFKKLHDTILFTESNIQSASLLQSNNKQTLGVTTDQYDWNENSVGEDNLGKIILALFSFQRLKETHPQDYKGGILAIDELDATMYPASQVRLLKVLKKYASRLNLQIFFTTHSLPLLEATSGMEDVCHEKLQTKGQVRIVFLKKVDGNIEVQDNAGYDDILLNLKVTVSCGEKKGKTVDAYTEDAETLAFVKALLLRNQKKHISFVKGTIGCKTLIDLSFRKLQPFIFPYSILVVDGDVRKETDVKKKILQLDNLLMLPGNESPERMMATFLHDLSDRDALWTSIKNGYSKQVCFSDIQYSSIMAGGAQGRLDAKEWFNKQMQIWGRRRMKVFNAFFKSISQEVQMFRDNFDKQLKRYGIDILK